jgi:hypothetical protein
MTFWTYNTGTAGERMRIDHLGNVGIGNTAPLPVAVTGYNWLIVGPSTNTGGTFGVICACGNTTGNGASVGSYNWINYASTSSDQRILTINGITDGAVNSGAFQFVTYSAGTSYERMRITSAGLVGIATASPAYLLDMGGFSAAANTLRIASASGSDASIRLMEADDTYGFSLENIHADGFYIKNHSASAAGAVSMYINRSSGNVGIGTASPTARLEIDLAGSSGATALYIQNPVGTWGTSTAFNSYRFVFTSSAATDGSFKQFHVGAGGVAIGYATTPVYGSADALYVNGRVGLGTTSPQYQLDFGQMVTTSARFGQTIIQNADNNGAANGYEWYLGAFTGWNTWQVIHRKISDGSWAAMFSVNGANGCVGINYGAATDGLVVNGLLGNQYGQVRMVSGNYGCFFRNDGTSFYVMTTASGDQFGTWRVPFPIQIDIASNCVGIHGAGVNASYGLQVDSINVSGGNYYHNGAVLSTGISGVTVQNQGATVSGGPFNLLNFYNNGSYQWGINNQGSGGVQIFVNVVSDARLKQNIRDLSGGLSFIERLQPKEYEFNGLGNTTAGQRAVGLLAQDLQQISPASVTSWRAKLHPEDEEETDLFRYDPPEITMHLVLAIQQLSARIKQLEGKGN